MTIITAFRHYIGVCVVLIVALSATYFVGSALLTQYESVLDKQHGPAVVYMQPTPQPGVATAVNSGAEALKDKALYAAMEGQIVQLSQGQQTIANAVEQVSGASARLAAGLTEGLTRPSPKAQVITIATKTTTTATPPPIVESDDAIQRDLKQVLKDTTVNTHVDTTVHVSWEDKPFSPIFAVYTNDNSSGFGYALHRAPALELDALVLTHPSGVHQSVAGGVGLEHIFKGTSAGLGIDATYNFATHKPNAGVYAAIHF